MSEIKWNLPTRDDAGYLRRKRELAELVEAAPTPENLDAMFKFLLPFIEKPENRKEAMEALLDMTEAEYGKVTLGMLGYVFKVPDPKAEK